MLIDELLREAVQRGASDLHITVAAPPTLRVHGELTALDAEPLTPEDILSMVKTLLPDDAFQRLDATGQHDFSHSVPQVSRFRINVYRQRGCYSISVRVVPMEVPTFPSLGLPTSILSLCSRKHGLILVTGPTGSGKSTTLASIIDWINHHQRKRIITLEDPIEYLHHHDLSIVDQREIGADTDSFTSGLRAALRQDPDVLLLGEMRDLETITTAITAAETGHLVFATLHTPDAPQSIDRVIDVFPPAQQQQIRVQMANVLIGIVAQRLLTNADGQTRVAAAEILVNTPAVANLIRTEKVHHIRTAMQTGKAIGMQTMEMSLRELFQAGKVTEEQCQRFVTEWGSEASFVR